MRGVGKVEHLHLLGDGIAYCDREFVFAAPEIVAVEEVAERHDARSVVGDLDAHGVGQGDDANAAGLEAQGDVFLKLLDFGDLDARGRSDLVEGDGGADDGLHIVHRDLVGLQGGDDLVVVAGELFAADFALAGGVVAKEFDAWELVPGEAFRRIHTVVDGLELLDLGLQSVVGDDLDVDSGAVGCGRFGGAGFGRVYGCLRRGSGLRGFLFLRLFYGFFSLFYLFLGLFGLLFGLGSLFLFNAGLSGAEGVDPVGELAG